MRSHLISSVLTIIGLFIIGLFVCKTAFGDDTAARPRKHSPPPQAYQDCKGKKSGDTVQHTTREGKVAATCEDSPEGLVARPVQPPGAKPDDSSPQEKQIRNSEHPKKAGNSE